MGQDEIGCCYIPTQLEDKIMKGLLHELILKSAESYPGNTALEYRDSILNYTELAKAIINTAHQLVGIGLSKHSRIATYLPKSPHNVITLFATSAAGGIFVPINPLLKHYQVVHILNDSTASILVTSSDRLTDLKNDLTQCKTLKTIVVIDGLHNIDSSQFSQNIFSWDNLRTQHTHASLHRVHEIDTTALLYTSGSTGAPKGVILSHKNMVAGAHSVASYLKNSPTDRILVVLPLSFDYGLSQLTTAFSVGACSVLMNYMLPMEVINMLQRESITGLAAVPPLWNTLVQLHWPSESTQNLRYITNSGGVLPLETIKSLQRKMPDTEIFLMYGLTEAFRSTYLPPEQINTHPTSIGKAIPNAEVWVLRKDGSPCEPGEPGELVHSGVLVSSGYWNDPNKTAHRFMPLPDTLKSASPDRRAVWSGDIVRADSDGYLYFIGRNDDLIKTSGYRVSTTEVEQILFSSKLLSEAVVLGVPHPTLGQTITAFVVPKNSELFDLDLLIDHCKRNMPSYMIPSDIEVRDFIPRDPNGKIARTSLAREFMDTITRRRKGQADDAGAL